MSFTSSTSLEAHDIQPHGVKLAFDDFTHAGEVDSVNKEGFGIRAPAASELHGAKTLDEVSDRIPAIHAFSSRKGPTNLASDHDPSIIACMIEPSAPPAPTGLLSISSGPIHYPTIAPERRVSVPHPQLGSIRPPSALQEPNLISRSGPSDQSRRELVGIEHHQIQTDFQPSPVWPVLPIDSASKKEDQAAVPLSRALQIPNTHHPCRQPAMGTISISGLTAFFHHGIKVDADKDIYLHFEVGGRWTATKHKQTKHAKVSWQDTYFIADIPHTACELRIKAIEHHSLRAHEVIGTVTRFLEEIDSRQMNLINFAHLLDTQGKAIGDVRFVAHLHGFSHIPIRQGPRRTAV